MDVGCIHDSKHLKRSAVLNLLYMPTIFKHFNKRNAFDSSEIIPTQGRNRPKCFVF